MNLEKFTERSRGFVQAAQTIAMRESHQRLLPEHLLKALMDDEAFIDSLYFLHTDPNDLRKMTLRERKEVVNQLYKQGERLLKVVA